LHALLEGWLADVPLLPGAELIDDEEQAIVTAKLGDPVVEVAEAFAKGALQVDRQVLPFDDLEDLGAEPSGALLTPVLFGSRLVRLVEMRGDRCPDQVAGLG